MVAAVVDEPVGAEAQPFAPAAGGHQDEVVGGVDVDPQQGRVVAELARVDVVDLGEVVEPEARPGGADAEARVPHTFSSQDLCKAHFS